MWNKIIKTHIVCSQGSKFERIKALNVLLNMNTHEILICGLRLTAVCSVYEEHLHKETLCMRVFIVLCV